MGGSHTTDAGVAGSHADSGGGVPASADDCGTQTINLSQQPVELLLGPRL